jgi:serine/threonine protein kinase
MTLPKASTGIPDRFVVERRLGAGAFGTVLVAWDQSREQRVALKRLERVDPASIYRFKQEFRALADVVHPNLVRLHELFALESGWCFTMDLVDGIRFDAWVRGLDLETPGEESTPPTTEGPGRTGSTVASGGSGRSGPLATETLPEAPRLFDEQRLRTALRGLGAGVLALHRAGILHRDLKPSNVLVRPDGRVLILDFGLVATGVVDAHQSADGPTAGTPAYMSPEQARGAPLTAASDWYAVGLMLYEALCGQLPFAGTVPEMMEARITEEPRDVRGVRGELPEDLAELCMAMLRRDPAERPSGAEIARQLGLEAGAPAPANPAGRGSAFVGRRREMHSLRRSFEQSRAGKTVVAHVHGPSGYGKTTLVRRFLADLATDPDEVVVLEGRCYERESVPFKALDELVDALGRYLKGLRPVVTAGLMPRDVRALVRLFPSLGRLDVMGALPGRAPTSDPHELRRRAFAALRELFARLTDTRPLVLFIDDVHWGDADSAALVRNLLAPPEVPPLLLVVGYRGDAPEDNELLRTLRSPMPSDSSWQTVDVPLGPLPAEEAEELALSLAAEALAGGSAGRGSSPAAALTSPHARAIAEESGGSPLFVAALVRAVASGRGSGEEVSLQRVLTERVRALPDETRAVLELLACSERPLDEAEMRGAADLDARALSAALDRLRDEHLVVASGGGGRNAYEVLHDKMRLAVREVVEPDRLRDRHARLAEILEAAGDVDPETLAHHYRAGAAPERALLWAERAGDRASEALAFEHAVRLYRLGLDLATGDARGRVMRKLAGALASAGRCAEAAKVFLEVAGAAAGEEALALRRRAAEQYLRAGHVAEAMTVFGTVLEEEGLALPRTPSRALASLLVRRARLKVRGLGFKERPEASVPRAELRRIDSCWTLGTGLAGIDLVRSAHYQAVCLSLALDSGEPGRVARSLAMEAILKSLEGAAGVVRAAALAARAKEIAARIGQPQALGLATAAEGVVAWGESRFADCASLCDQASVLMRERSEDSFREIGSLEVWFALHSLFLRGELRKVEERGPACVREAEARGDRYTASTARAYILPLLWAARDRPDEGRREADAAVAVWPRDSWYHQHWARLRALCFLDLYEGQGGRALERLEESRHRMKKSMQLRIRTLRFESAYLEGRGALARALEVNGAERAALLSRAAEASARTDAEGNPLAAAYAQAVRAGIAALREPPAAAAAAFAEARQRFERLEMPFHAAAADRRRGEILGGEEGARLVESTTRTLSGRGVADPARFSDLLLPRAARPA